ncbi:MAG: HigA family addiction module antidote protein [Phycisphaerae bacterium]|nr:HigA family addiction module antidote protein [Phycisphaerae bacterium]
MTTTRRPTHPGRVLKCDVIEALGLTVTEAAKRLGVTRKALSELLNEHAAMSPEMAVRVARATSTTAESWLRMQLKLDLWEAEQDAPQVRKLEPIGA